MKKKKCLILGISGQDGSYLAENLVERGDDVYGIIRRHSVSESQDTRIAHLDGTIKTEYGDILDVSSLERIVNLVKPDEIYNLAAMSHVRISFNIPLFTVQTNALGTANILEVYRNFAPNARFYQASSSEIYGDTVDEDGFQREESNKTPVSPYGCAKLFSYHLVRNYRKSYGLFASNGILYNHESPRRGSNFVSSKVVKAAVLIKLGIQDKLVLGNMDSYRDWGHSNDYCKAMMKILEYHKPDDFVISTGETHSVRDMCDYVFKKLGMDYKDYVIQDKKFLRPEELPYLRGDSSKARNELNWEPTYTFETLLDEMIDHWMRIYTKKIKDGDLLS